MFQVTNDKGQVVATYENRSEADTYIRQSFPGCKVSEDGEVREGEATIFDAEDNEIGSIRLPRDAESAATTRERSGSSASKGKGKGKGSGPAQRLPPK